MGLGAANTRRVRLPADLLMRLRTTPILLPASEVFAADELAARLDSHADRVAAGPDDEPGRGYCACFACGVRSGAKYAPGKGWHSRQLEPGSEAMELYCPTCFALWGWPDVPDHPDDDDDDQPHDGDHTGGGPVG